MVFEVDDDDDDDDDRDDRDDDDALMFARVPFLRSMVLASVLPLAVSVGGPLGVEEEQVLPMVGRSVGGGDFLCLSLYSNENDAQEDAWSKVRTIA